MNKELAFAQKFQAIREKILEDPIKYFVRAPGLINVNPTPAQTVLLKSVFGQELDSITKHKVYVEVPSGTFTLEEQELTEVELYEYMTGFKYEPNNKKYNRINLICGRRSGKSLMSAIIALYSAIKTNWKPYLRKHPVATIAVLSHTVEFSQEILDVLKALVEDSPVLSKLRDTRKKNTQTVFHLKVPFIEDEELVYSYVAIKVGAASKKTTRGRAVCTALMDEIAFWALNLDAAESDRDILRALRPSLLQFGDEGTIIKLSSPAIKQGVLYEEWERRADLKEDYIQLKAPSWVMNNMLPVEEFYREYRLDPDGFNTEFRANFTDSISNFILPEYVDSCVNPATFIPPSQEKNVTYTAAMDAAFKGDKFVFTIVGHNESRITQHVLKIWEGSRQDPVKAHEVAKFIGISCKQFGVSTVHADQYAFQPLREIFEQYGISLVETTFTNAYKKKIYYGLKRLIHNNNLDILNNSTLIKEIKELIVEQTPTGQIRIGHPQNGTDDAADALAIACYQAMLKSGNFKLVEAEVALGNTYGIQVDATTGRALTAPAPEMLKDYKGFNKVIDNSAEYGIDPADGKMKRRADFEDEDEENQVNFLF